jgi:hypothetical protein
MYTTHRATWDAKNRHELPEELAFDFASIAHIFKKNLRKAPDKVKEEDDDMPFAGKSGTASAALSPPPALPAPSPPAAPPAAAPPPPASDELLKAADKDWTEYSKNGHAEWKAPPLPPG